VSAVGLVPDIAGFARFWEADCYSPSWLSASPTGEVCPIAGQAAASFADSTENSGWGLSALGVSGKLVIGRKAERQREKTG